MGRTNGKVQVWSQGIQLGCYKSGPGTHIGGAVDLNGGNEDRKKEKIMEYMVEVKSVVVGTNLMGKEDVLD